MKLKYGPRGTRRRRKETKIRHDTADVSLPGGLGRSLHYDDARDGNSTFTRHGQTTLQTARKNGDREREKQNNNENRERNNAKRKATKVRKKKM